MATPPQYPQQQPYHYPAYPPRRRKVWPRLAGVQECAEKHHHRDAKPYNAAIVDDFAADEALTFVEVDGKWYWFGASTSSGPDPGDFG